MGDGGLFYYNSLAVQAVRLASALVLPDI